jgi:hypothetical protein
MNRAELIRQMNCHCESLGGFGFCIHTPFSYAGDGESIRVFVRELSDGGLVIYDGGDALLHLESQGCRLTGSRLEKIRSLLRDPVALNGRGEITATCQGQQASLVLPEVIDAVLLVNHLGSLWGLRH